MNEPTKPLKIGISAFFQHSFFSNGIATTMLSIADALAKLGHTPVLINTNMTKEWYDDCESLKGVYERRNLVEWSEKKYELLDYFIDIDGFLIPEQRRRIGKKVIVFLRKPIVLTELEGLVYPIQQPVRNVRECDAIWTWEQFGEQDVAVMELLSRKPVFRIPYTWSEKGVDAYSKDHPSWLSQSNPKEPWEAHTIESNQSVASNTTLPLVILARAKTETKVPLNTYSIHNASKLEEEKFFKENVYAHCTRSDLTIQFLGRQRCGDFRMQSNSFILSHIRFIDRKPYLLDCIWNGIPVVHNSTFLKNLGHGLERLYYEDNSVVGAVKAIETMHEEYKARSGFFSEGCLDSLRQTLLSRFNPLSNRTAWDSALSFQATKVEKTEVVVGFSDLWDDANPTYNFWLLLLQEACPSVKFRGVAITEKNTSESMDLLIYGPFGQVWTQVPESVPKVHITGENTGSKTGNGTYLNLGFEATNLEKGVYRFPLWVQYIDWFGADQERLQNPRSMPIDSLVKYDINTLKKKEKFCAFVVTNPSNPIRNNAFQLLSSYKQVDSAGRLFNNVGDALFAKNAGGGGGELKKLEFLKNYKFSLTYENAQNDGYITEKLLAAKAAGAVPIYWGAKNVYDDFAEGSFINVTENPDDLWSAVKNIGDSEWLQMASKPCIDIQKERARLAEVASLVLKPILSSKITIPTYLGASSTEEALALRVKREGPVLEPAPLTLVTNATWNGKRCFVTFATERFLHSLAQWLGPPLLYMKQDSNVSIRVYMGDDIDEMRFNLFSSDYPTVTFHRLPTKTVMLPNFPDVWEPQHFAWKLWIYQALVSDVSLSGSLVFYTDSGSILVRWPQAWMNRVVEHGICVLEDKEQKNDQWCHTVFCKKLEVTPEEKCAQQIVGGLMAFIGGSLKPLKFFSEAWSWAQQKDVIVGPKWSGLLPDGRPYGHRHDQSILSILRLRHGLSTYPLEEVYNHESLRRTFKSGQCIYVHRGNVKEHVNFSDRIGEVHLINLEKRSDRIKRFKENHESWAKQVCLRPAYDGLKLQLTPNLARLFATNDFFWKKAVMGCALSHLSLWVELSMEEECCENYLILEDDVKLEKGWLNIWKEASKVLPEDYDVLYLGGILPPNKPGLSSVLEPVNSFWSKIKPNQLFGQTEPTSYYHFCNYAYILSRKGAKKLLEDMQRMGGYTTSADHMICNRNAILNLYTLSSLIAGCYQDDDPLYQTSQFNDFSRIDTIDSDLWNNNERFSKEEIEKAFENGSPNVNILQMLQEARNPILSTPLPNNKSRIYTVEFYRPTLDGQMELRWLCNFVGNVFDSMEALSQDHIPLSTGPIFLVARPHIEKFQEIFLRYESLGLPFYAIHLSDEYGQDPIDWYSYKSCKGVLRNYNRPECLVMSHVKVVPLGPNRRTTDVKPFETRELAWSFFGTQWHNRQKDLQPLCASGPYMENYYETWMDAKQLTAEAYSAMLLNSKFIPCPRGQNVETFRFWEALEHGSIPIYVRSPGDTLYVEFLTTHLPSFSAFIFETWECASRSIEALLNDVGTCIQVRTLLLDEWLKWKNMLKVDCKRILQLTA